MKSKGLTPWMPWIAVVVVLLIIGIGYYYHDSGVQSITKYYLIKYTPPLPETDVLGYPKMTDPEFEIKEEVSTFESDSAAVAKCKEDKKGYFEIWNETLPELLAEADKETDARSVRAARSGTMDAYRSAMAQQWTLIRISHTPSFDPKEVLEQLPDIWQDRDKIEALREKYKIDIALYPIL